MLIYGAAVDANYNAPLQPNTHKHTHTNNPLMAHINPHVISRSPPAPKYIKEVVHAADQHWIELPMMQFIIIHTFYLLSHSNVSAFLNHSGSALQAKH